MRYRIASKSKHLAVLLVFTVFVPAAIAGPPLTCHPFQIGDAGSLPWGGNSDSGEWNTPKKDYDSRQLFQDTMALLTDKAPVIVRMETIRRAALYSVRKTADAQELLNRLRARALEQNITKRNALYLFDYGYIIETMKQAWLTRKTKENDSPAEGLEGLPYIQEALALRGSDSQMEFAAAIVTSWPKHASHTEHLRKAFAGAAQDPLLAKNLAIHFSDQDRIAAKAN